MKSLKINPTAIRTRGKGAVRAREGETYRPRLGIYLLKFDIDNKMTQTQRAKFDDIKPQYCLDCIMFCMGMMYKLEWKAATEDGAEEKSGAAAGTAARPATAPAQAAASAAAAGGGEADASAVHTAATATAAAADAAGARYARC